MTPSSISRRTLVQGGGAALAGLSVLRLAGPAHAFPRAQDAVVIPWLDQPEPNPVPEVIVRQLTWEELDSWITPEDQFFVIKHFDEPTLTEADYRLEIGGLVEQPMTLTLADLKARERQEVTFTLECSGNSAFPFNKGWWATPPGQELPSRHSWRRRVWQEAGIEVVFWGADAGEQIWREEITVTEQFARSMSLTDACNPDNLLAYEMNGEDLPNLHGYPVRLIAPGWYGVANVKWLTRIEVLDRRYRVTSWPATTSPSAKRSATGRRSGPSPRSPGPGSSRLPRR